MCHGRDGQGKNSDAAHFGDGELILNARFWCMKNNILVSVRIQRL